MLNLTKDKQRKLVQGHGLRGPTNLGINCFSDIANFVEIIGAISYSFSSERLLGWNVKQSLGL